MMFIYLIGYFLGAYIAYLWLSKEFKGDSEIVMNIILSMFIGFFSWLVVLVGLIYVLIKNERLNENR